LIDGDLPDEKTVWTTIVDKKPLGPHRQHYFDIERSVPLDQVFSHVRYSVYPGMSSARFTDLTLTFQMGGLNESEYSGTHLPPLPLPNLLFPRPSPFRLCP
jgi:hypothetical protein